MFDVNKTIYALENTLSHFNTLKNDIKSYKIERSSKKRLQLKYLIVDGFNAIASLQVNLNFATDMDYSDINLNELKSYLDKQRIIFQTGINEHNDPDIYSKNSYVTEADLTKIIEKINECIISLK